MANKKVSYCAVQRQRNVLSHLDREHQVELAKRCLTARGLAGSIQNVHHHLLGIICATEDHTRHWARFDPNSRRDAAHPGEEGGVKPHSAPKLQRGPWLQRQQNVHQTKIYVEPIRLEMSANTPRTTFVRISSFVARATCGGEVAARGGERHQAQCSGTVYTCTGGFEMVIWTTGTPGAGLRW